MTEKWAKGELSRNALMGWAVEHWHWVSHISPASFYVCAKAPADVVQMQLENYREENDEAEPHLEFVLRFARANGANIDHIRAGRGLPTTEAWYGWLNKVAKDEPWIAGVAVAVGTESQSPLLYGKVLPALRESYKFPEEDIKHFWLHEDADTKHGGRAFDVLERYCCTPELREMAMYYVRESARRRWFYFDGIYLHYELEYFLQ